MFKMHVFLSVSLFVRSHNRTLTTLATTSVNCILSLVSASPAFLVTVTLCLQTSVFP